MRIQSSRPTRPSHTLIVVGLLIAFASGGSAAETAVVARSPQSSQAAQPAWWSEPGLHTLLGGSKAYAPASDWATSLYLAAEKAETAGGTLSGASLVCSVDLGERKLDGLAPFASRETMLGDISLAAGIAAKKQKAPRWVALGEGPEDRNTAWVFMPLVDLSAGQDVVIRVMDRDLTFHDLVTVVRIPYRGKLPFSIRNRVVEAACRLVPADQVDSFQQRTLTRVAEALAKAERQFTVSLDGNPGQSVDRQLALSQEAISQAAALAGWDDPRLAEPRARLDDLTERLEQAYGQAFEQQRLALSTAGSNWRRIAAGQLSFKLTAVTCPKAKLSPYRQVIDGLRLLPREACALRLAVRNETDGKMVVDESKLGPLYGLKLLDARGETAAHFVKGIWRGGRARSLPFDGLSLRPGQEIELVVPPMLGEEMLMATKLPLLLLSDLRSSLSAAGLTEPTDLAGGRFRVQALGLDCSKERGQALAKLVFLPSWKQPVCGLRLRLENRSPDPLALAAFLNDLHAVDGKGDWHKVQGVLAPGETERKMDRAYQLPPGASAEGILVFYEYQGDAQSLRLGRKFLRNPLFLSLIDQAR